MHARCRNCFIAVVLLNQGSGTGYGGNILVMTEPAASNTAATLIRFSKGDTHDSIIESAHVQKKKLLDRKCLDRKGTL